MFQRIIDDVKDTTSSALRQASLAGIAALTLIITFGFLCAAGFIYVLDHAGAIIACLAGAGLFLLITLVAVAWYAISKQQTVARARQRARAAARNPLADPAMLATGLQIVRVLGAKRLIPILAVGGALALGLLASRSIAANDQAPAE